MAPNVPKSGFVILSGDRSIPVPADDFVRVLSSVKGASEIFESLRRVASDKNVLGDARMGGNGNGVRRQRR